MSHWRKIDPRCMMRPQGQGPAPEYPIQPVPNIPGPALALGLLVSFLKKLSSICRAHSCKKDILNATTSVQQPTHNERIWQHAIGSPFLRSSAKCEGTSALRGSVSTENPSVANPTQINARNPNKYSELKESELPTPCKLNTTTQEYVCQMS